jgi:hypothetical protein
MAPNCGKNRGRCRASARERPLRPIGDSDQPKPATAISQGQMRVTKSENGIKNKKNTKILANKTKKHIKNNLVFYDICFLCQR